MEKYLKRDKQIIEDEKRWIEELKKVEVLIKKQEREQNILRKTIKMDYAKDEELDQEAVDNIVKLYRENREQIQTVPERFVYLRSQWANESFPIPQKVQKKVNSMCTAFNSARELDQGVHAVTAGWADHPYAGDRRALR